MKALFTKQFFFVTALILIAIASRFTGVPNVNPIVAIALFGGAYFADKRLAFIVPIFALFISDLIIGLHSTMWAVYGSFALIAVIGMYMKNRISFVSVPLAAVGSSVLFFVLTNFAVWLTGWYPMTFDGLVTCYTMAIPFFRNSLISDVVFAAVLFGTYEYVKVRVPSLVTA